MCQMKVVLDENGGTEKVMDDVTRLEVIPEGVVLSTFFESDRLVPGTRVKTIDFMKTTITLAKINT